MENFLKNFFGFDPSEEGVVQRIKETKIKVIDELVIHGMNDVWFRENRVEEKLIFKRGDRGEISITNCPYLTDDHVQNIKKTIKELIWDRNYYRNSLTDSYTQEWQYEIETNAHCFEIVFKRTEIQILEKYVK